MSRMNDEAVQAQHDRTASKAHFHARISRYGNLLKEKWWVLTLGALVGLAIRVESPGSSRPLTSPSDA